VEESSTTPPVCAPTSWFFFLFVRAAMSSPHAATPSARATHTPPRPFAVTTSLTCRRLKRYHFSQARPLGGVDTPRSAAPDQHFPGGLPPAARSDTVRPHQTHSAPPLCNRHRAPLRSAEDLRPAEVPTYLFSQIQPSPSSDICSFLISVSCLLLLQPASGFIFRRTGLQGRALARRSASFFRFFPRAAFCLPHAAAQSARAPTALPRPRAFSSSGDCIQLKSYVPPRPSQDSPAHTIQATRIQITPF